MADCLGQALLPDRCVGRGRASVLALLAASAVALLIGSSAVIYFPWQRHIPVVHEEPALEEPALEAGDDSPPRVSALIVTHNHDEAFGLDGRRAVVEELRAQISQNDPDIVAMMSQEVRTQGREKPLHEAIRGLDYTWIGFSDIAGRTKVWCYQVDTAVQVAVSNRLLADLESASAEHCGSSGVCSGDESDRTTFRYHTWLYRTKGHVAVHLSIKSLGFAIRFAGVHLDTSDFDVNLKSHAAPAFGEFERDSPGVTVVAGDFNSRMAESGYSQMCRDGAITGNRLVEAMDVDRPDVLDVLRLSEVVQLLQDGAREAASDDRLRAELVPPAVGEAEGKFFILPTYRFPSDAQVKSEDVAGRAIELFGKHGSEVCQRRKFGVLDSVAAIYNPDKITVDLPPRATWKKLSGSDHALISARILLSGARIPVQV